MLVSSKLIIFIIRNHLESGGLWNKLTSYINKICLNLLSTSTLNCSIRSTVTTSSLTCKFSFDYSAEFMLFIKKIIAFIITIYASKITKSSTLFAHLWST